MAMQRLARAVPIAPHVTAYAVALLAATHPDQPRAPEIVREYVRYGGSPRGAQALVAGAKVRALLDGRFNVSVEDLRAVALPSAAPPDHPQLRGRGRGDHRRRDRPHDPRQRRPAGRRVGARRGPAPWSAPPRTPRPGRPAGRVARLRPAAIRRSCRPTSTRPSSTRPSCAAWSACPCSSGTRSAAASRAAGGASSAASRSSSPTTGTTPWATTCASSTGTSTPGSRSCFVKLFIEEEDLTVTFLVDGSASMAHGTPDKLVFAKRAAAALGYIALAAEDRVVLASLARPDGAATGSPARLGARVPAPRRALGDPAGRRRRPTSSPPAGTPWPR